MSKTMLIDATRPEETRVVIADGSRLEDYDVSVASKKQIKGNVYLAKVVRVEPSLQAAFLDYGHDRHGFLSFDEVHPDYFQIPVADREALVAEDSKLAKIESEEEVESDREDSDEPDEADPEDGEEEAPSRRRGRRRAEDPRRSEVRRRAMLYRRYTIQEVVRHNQLVLVQARKEERGTKGASFTTYISLPGRYMVLLPNKPHGRGMSRKIDTLADRKRLRKIIQDIEVPEGMSTILRTAGQGRTKSEIRRDLDYLVQLWSDIREGTLKSVGPTLVHQENDIVKRAVRDLYQSDVDEVIVAGEEAYQSAKDLVKTLTPSKARHVKHYRGEAPFFHHHGVERALGELHDPAVDLPSGGSMVFAQTEALVTVDINSGRAIRERHIEETALKTNLEAAVEAARQFRLRDLAGLIVIDFIGMEERRNNNAVEQRLREALKDDRARTQVGRMSEFGLIEMSRQRLRQSVLDTQLEPCAVCNGTGRTYLPEAHALMTLRALETRIMDHRGSRIEVRVPGSCAGHLANRMRRTLLELEEVHDVEIDVISTSKVPAVGYSIEAVPKIGVSGETRGPARRRAGATRTARDSSGTRRRGERSRAGAQDRPAPEDDEERPSRTRRRGGGRGRAATSVDADALPENASGHGDEDERPSGPRRSGERGRSRPMAAELDDDLPEEDDAPLGRQSDDREERPTRTRRRGGRGRGRAAAAERDGDLPEDDAPLAWRSDEEERPPRARGRGRAAADERDGDLPEDDDAPLGRQGDEREERPTRARRRGGRGRGRAAAAERDGDLPEDDAPLAWRSDEEERPPRARGRGRAAAAERDDDLPEDDAPPGRQSDEREERPPRTRRRGGRGRGRAAAAERDGDLPEDGAPLAWRSDEEERPPRARGRGRAAAVESVDAEPARGIDIDAWGDGGDPILPVGREPVFEGLPPDDVAPPPGFDPLPDVPSTDAADRADPSEPERDPPEPKRGWWSKKDS